MQVFFFARIHKRFGHKRVYIVGMGAYGLLTLSLPFMNLLARKGMMRAMWVLMGVHLLFTCPAFMAFSKSSLVLCSTPLCL